MSSLMACSNAPGLLDPRGWLQATKGRNAPPTPDPALRYLRADSGGQTSYLVLGDIESRPEGETEVYYSALGEVVRLRQGRIVGTAGLPVDWRAVRQSGLPEWPALLATSGDAAATREYLRERDVMPGYRYSIRETVAVRPIVAQAPPDAVAPADALLRWFEESTADPGARAALPPARFAVDPSAVPPRVVYSEQCLAATFCLRLQAWPPRTSGPAAAGRAG